MSTIAYILLILLAAQQTIRVDVSLVTIGVRVTDSRGRDVSGLQAGDFSVFEDGVQQKIALFSSDTQPIALGILLDRSSSMVSNEKITRAKEAARALVEGMLEGSEFSYIDFNETVKRGADFKIEVRCDGNACDFYEGGGLLGRLNDVKNPEGRVGLLLSFTGEAVFRGLTVEQIQ